jgi:tRNA pseudouridine38-40 synthase
VPQLYINSSVPLLIINSTVPHIFINPTVSQLIIYFEVSHIYINPAVPHLINNSTVSHIYINSAVPQLIINSTQITLNNANPFPSSEYSMRYAFKFAYDGTGFTGSQRQPKQKTVEGEILSCLNFHHVIDDSKSARFQVASRTDSGVSALGNVLALNANFKKKDIMNILNSKLDNCWFYGVTQVDDKFNPRHAKLRWYRYHMLDDGKIDFDSIKKVAQCFKGEHDFRNFSNPHVESTIRTIDSIEVTKIKNWIVIDVKAPGFLWNQVRRIVNACIRVGKDELDSTSVKDAMANPTNNQNFGLAPPEPLVLMDIKYDFEFDVDKQILEKTKQRILSAWVNVRLKETLLSYLLERM